MDLHHTEPDGNRLAPHHHYTGLAIAAVGAGLMGDLIGVLIFVQAAFGVVFFGRLWRPPTQQYGAAGSLVSVATVLVVGVLALAAGEPYAGVVILGALVALDDVYQHVTGNWAPLDAAWKWYRSNRRS